MALSHPYQSDLRRLIVQVASQVSGRFAICLGHQHRFGKTAETVFDPGCVQEIAFLLFKMSVEIEARIVVARSGDSTKGAKVILASVAETVKVARDKSALSREAAVPRAALDGRDARPSTSNRMLKRHTDVGQVEIVRLSEPRRLQIVRICEKGKTVNAMMPAPVRALGHCRMVEAVAIQARDAALEELRIPFQIGANWIALCG